MKDTETFQGDESYSIPATGDCVVGDQVKFSRAVFSGSWKRPKFSHYETVVGEIVSDSYGSQKQQHTFTLLLVDGSKTRIKGRNLYRNGVFRKEWDDETARGLALDEKHERGQWARHARECRINDHYEEFPV